MIYGDKRSFAKGELAPEILSRTDIASFETGASRLENFIVRVTGGVTRSPGLRFVAEAKYHDRDAILVPFVFSSFQAYIIEMGDRYARFFMNRGRIETGGAPYEIETPWTADQVRGLTWAQEADVLYLFHPDTEPQKLSRFGHTDWRLATLSPTDGPFLDENADTTVTVRASAVTGSGITLIATGADLWTPEQAGSLFRLGEADVNGVQPWETGRAFTIGDQARFDGNVYEVAARNGNTGSVPPVHLEGLAWDGQASATTQWRYLHSGEGILRLDTILTPRLALATVLSRLPDSVASAPTYRWAEAAWSGRRGFPAAATFVDQRLVAAATRDRPMSFWGSVAAGNYERFESGSLADQGFAYRLASRQVNTIRWLINAPVLLLGAADTVWVATGGDVDAPITPEAIRVRPTLDEGAAAVGPVPVSNAVLFVSHDGSRLMELSYDGGLANFTLRDLTLLAAHIGQV